MVDKHELVKEFPGMSDKIHELKSSDNHFKKLFDKYNELDNEIKNIEEKVENTSDFYMEDLKKKRIAVKDEIAVMLKKAG